MTTNIKVTSVTHDDLVNLFSTAFYGNSSYCIDYDAEKYAEFIKDQECIEDKMAEIILHGGEIEITDMNAEDEEEPTKNESNPCVTTMEEIVVDGWYGNIYTLPTYHVTLVNILNGMSSEKGYKLAKELLVDEDGDMITADCLMQIIMFGTIIYS